MKCIDRVKKLCIAELLFRHQLFIMVDVNRLLSLTMLLLLITVYITLCYVRVTREWRNAQLYTTAKPLYMLCNTVGKKQEGNSEKRVSFETFPENRD